MTTQLLTCKELAAALRKHVSYVYAMRRRGFQMRGNVATLDAALDFLNGCPNPKAHNVPRGRDAAGSNG